MTSNTILLVGLDELEPSDVLHWLKADLARDLAAMRIPKNLGERRELLYYAFRRLSIGMEKLMCNLDADAYAELPYGQEYPTCCPAAIADDGERYYDEHGDPPWEMLPDWAEN